MYHIAFLTEYQNLGGGETSLLNLLQVIHDRGHKPILFAPFGKLSKQADRLGIKTIAIAYPQVRLKGGILPLFSVSTILKLRHHFLKNKIQIVHAESLSSVYYGGLAAFFSGLKMVATYHGFWSLKSTFSQLFFRYFCYRIYPVSKSTMHQIAPIFKNKSNRIRLIYLGVGEKFLKDVPHKKIARQKLDLSGEQSIIVHIARFQSIKGHDYLIEALHILKQKMGSDCPLLIFVGDVHPGSPDEYYSYKQLVHKKAQSSEIRQYIKFVGERDDSELFLKAADLSVSPSRYETFGMTTIEAMVLGTPVVATKVGGSKELIVHGETGYLVNPEDPAALAEGIFNLLTDNSKATAIARKAEKIALDNFGPDKRVIKLLEEYHELTHE